MSDQSDAGGAAGHAAEARQIARAAAQAAGAGNSEEGRAGIARALSLAPTDVEVLFLAFQFHFRAGELDEAERLVQRRIAALGPDTLSADAGRAWTNLALIHIFRRSPDTAQLHAQKALDIDRAIGHDYGVSRDMHNLAMVHELRGDPDRAEALYLEALAIAERIGADDLAASKHANLGDIAHARNDATAAMSRWSAAGALFARLGEHAKQEQCAARIAGTQSPRA